MPDIGSVPGVAALLVPLVGPVWSVVQPERPVWLPPGRCSRQYVLNCIRTSAAVGLSVALPFLERNT